MTSIKQEWWLTMLLFAVFIAGAFAQSKFHTMKPEARISSIYYILLFFFAKLKTIYNEILFFCYFKIWLDLWSKRTLKLRSVMFFFYFLASFSSQESLTVMTNRTEKKRPIHRAQVCNRRHNTRANKFETVSNCFFFIWRKILCSQFTVLS